jgi:hypothetical protein
MTTIVIKDHEWERLRPRIDADYGKITTMISWRLKESLGFTVRRHRYFDDDTGRYQEDVRLDFANETAATFFRMKYL